MKTIFCRTAALPLCAILAAGTLTTAGCMSNAEPVTGTATHNLVNTHWRVTMLGGEVIENPPGERDVHFTLQENNLVVTGNSGCNRMFGHYALNGDSIKFDQMGGTKMFCEARMELEQKFLEMFSAVTGWKITGNTLQLLDANGNALGTFESN